MVNSNVIKLRKKSTYPNGNVIKLRSLKQKSPLLFDEQWTFNLDIYPYKLTFMSLLFL